MPGGQCCGLIVGWYQAHRQGAAKRPVSEDLIAEVLPKKRQGKIQPSIRRA